MKIKILYDKRAVNEKFNTGWGVSFLIDNKILFDTGDNGEKLIENINSLDIDINKIEAVVISHDHWDHWGGLWEFLKKRNKIRVYVCGNSGAELKDKVVDYAGVLSEVSDFTEIEENIFLTSEIAGSYKDKFMAEQAIVLKTRKGNTVITGCAHPDIVKIVKTVKEKYPKELIYLVMGGFHLKDSSEEDIIKVIDNLKSLNVLKTAPTHCSGDKAEDMFKQYFKNNFIMVEVGKEIEV